MAQPSARCPDCGSPSVDAMLPGLCPACLMALAVKDAATVGVTAGTLGVVELDAPIDESDAAPTTNATPDDAMWIGPYRVVRRIAEGGMGVVYEAEQEQPIARTVAVKVVRAGLEGGEVVARFRSERQALALMNHPNIAKVFDAGTTADGRPYFAMELVRGEPITKYCDRRQISTRARLELFVQACEAVQHAHQKGIIHRDIKPNNVLVTVEPDRPLVKVIDFGIAKALGTRLAEQTLYTEHGQLLGTPAYMSPEQLERGSLDVDTRADVYGLGVLLYELLTGGVPVDAGTSASTSFGTLRRALLAGEPPSPSARVSQLQAAERERVAAARGTRWGELHRTLRSELEWIPLKAIRAERAARYSSAQALAEDVRNYLSGRPLLAGPRSRAYLARKFVRNHRVGVGLVSVSAVLILGLIVGLSIATTRLLHAESSLAVETGHAKEEAAHARLAQRRAEQARQEAVRELLAELLHSGDLEAASNPEDAHKDYLHALDKVHEMKVDDAAILARLFAVPGPDLPLMGALGNAGGVGGFTGLGHPNCVALLPGDRVAVTCENFHPELTFWDLRTGRLLRQLDTGHSTGVSYVAVSPDGRSIYSAGFDHVLKRWDVETGAPLGKFEGHEHDVFVVAPSPDGLTVASGDASGKVISWNVADCSKLYQINAHAFNVAAIVYTRDGKRFASAGHDGTVKVWLAASGEPDPSWTPSAPGRAINTLVWNADETALFSGGLGDGVVRWWDGRSPDSREVFARRKKLWRLALSPDGTRLACGYDDGPVVLLDSTTGKLVHEFEGHKGAVLGLAFARDGRSLIATGTDSLVRVWSTVEPGRFVRVAASGHVTCGAIADDGLTLLGTERGTLLLCDGADGRVLRELPAHGGPITGVRLVSGGTRAVTCGRDGALKLWELSNAGVLKQMPGGTDGAPLQLAVTSERTVVVRTEKGLFRWNFEDGSVVKVEEAGIACVAAGVGPRAMAVARDDGAVRWMDVSAHSPSDDPPARNLPRRPGRPTAIAVSPNGNTVTVAAGRQVWTYVLSPDAVTTLGPTDGGVGEIRTMAFLGDGSTVLLGGQDGQAELWDVARSTPVAHIASRGADLSAIALSPGGRRALSIDAEGIARVWDFSKAAVQRSFELRLPVARNALGQQAGDPVALAAFADWYTFRGRPDWAADLLSESGTAAAAMPHLAWARLRERAGDRAVAAREYRAAAMAGEISPLLAELLATSLEPPPGAATAPSTTKSAGELSK